MGTHEFQKSLVKGKKGEKEFYELFKDKIEQLDGYSSDARILKSGETIELKTETRCATETPNIFVEKFSFSDVPGGPWQALKKGSTYYIHFFPKTMEFFVYKTATLVKYLDENHPKPWLHNIRNSNHMTRGFTIKRTELESIQLNLEDIL